MTTFSHADIKQCNRTFKNEARNWDIGLDLQAEPGSRQAYVSAAKHLINLSKPFLPVSIRNRGVSLESGLSTTACFAHTAACVAVKHSLDQPTLTRLFRGPESVQTLLIPARTRNRVAVSIEDYIGLRATDWHDTIRKVSQYVITKNGFALASPVQSVSEAVYYGNNDIDDPTALPAGRCPAPKLGMIYPLIDAMATIADTDPRLFAATLADRQVE